MTIILGIDPGSRVTGFGLVHFKYESRVPQYIASGCIRTTLAPTLSERLGMIFEGINEIITQYHPHIVAIEKVFLKHNVLSALKLGHARGAAMTACAMHGLEVIEYAPRAIKKAVVGYGAAEKAQVQKMIVELLSLNHAPATDAADALAIAICHGHHHAYSLRGYTLPKKERTN
jgi:crossover junction endodeoxyribonuclease RuvC